ncbi:MAG: hypothetical protein EZS28_026027, partial [Streblomastix strix]
QPELGDEIGKFLQAVQQPTLQHIERQLTPRNTVSERTQALQEKVLQAIVGVHASEIDFWATNILDEQNGKAFRREIQRPSILPITSVPVPDEVLNSKRRLIDKILQCEQALVLNNFRIDDGKLGHLDEQQPEQLAINVLSKVVHYLREAERMRFVRPINENGTNANYFNFAANTINSHLNSQTGSNILGAHAIAQSDKANKDAIGITNLLFGVLQLGKGRVKTKIFRYLTSLVTWKQIMRPMLNQNENQAFEQNQETQIIGTQNDMLPLNAGSLVQPPFGQGPTGSHAPRNAVRPQATIFFPALNIEQEISEISNVMTKETVKDHIHRWMSKVQVRVPVGNDDKGQHWFSFGPGVLYAIDWRQSKQQGLAPSMEEVNAFWREYNIDLRVARLMKYQYLEDYQETLQQAKTTRQEFKNSFRKHRNRSLSSYSKKLRYASHDRRSQSRDRTGSRGYSRSRDYQISRGTRIDIDRNWNEYEYKGEPRGRRLEQLRKRTELSRKRLIISKIILRSIKVQPIYQIKPQQDKESNKSEQNTII